MTGRARGVMTENGVDDANTRRDTDTSIDEGSLDGQLLPSPPPPLGKKGLCKL
jgi:hypothetical protein